MNATQTVTQPSARLSRLAVEDEDAGLVCAEGVDKAAFGGSMPCDIALERGR